jgi:hypothetical protein
VIEDSSHLSLPTTRTAAEVDGFSVLKLKSEKSILGVCLHNTCDAAEASNVFTGNTESVFIQQMLFMGANNIRCYYSK